MTFEEVCSRTLVMSQGSDGLTVAEAEGMIGTPIDVTPDGCWIGRRFTNDGYVVVMLPRTPECPSRTSTTGHRLIYEAVHGPLPDGGQLHHICHERDTECRGEGRWCKHRGCVRPSHVEPVSPMENTNRSWDELPRSELAHRLRTVRRDAHVTQAELARRLGVARSMPALWETDRRDPPPNIEQLYRAATGNQDDGGEG